MNPEILIWARRTAGLSVKEAAHALGFKDTSSRSAAERLEILEAGEEEPSRSVLLRMAKAYRRSLLVFYLKEPPRTGDRGQDFRTVAGAQPPLFDPVLDALIRDLRGRQTIAKFLLQENEASPVPFIGIGSIDQPAEALARRMVEEMSFSLTEYRRQQTIELAFRYLRTKIEGTGVFLLLLGNLGSHHTNISTDIFRGFAIADHVAPFIVINDQDARAAWAFTAIHELAHLWLGTTGVSSISSEARIERYCNDAASEVLFPAVELEQLARIRTATLSDTIDAITTFAKDRKISRAMVAYKLQRAGVIGEARWRELGQYLRQEWLASRARREDQVDERGGPSYYVVKRHRLGNALLSLARSSLGEGILTPTKAGQLLGVKPRNVDPLLSGALLGEGR